MNNREALPVSINLYPKLLYLNKLLLDIIESKLDKTPNQIFIYVLFNRVIKIQLVNLFDLIYTKINQFSLLNQLFFEKLKLRSQIIITTHSKRVWHRIFAMQIAEIFKSKYSLIPKA